MRRGGAALERLAVSGAGLVLVAVGAAAVAWERGWIPGAVERLDLTAVIEWTEAEWWPWAAGGVGVALIVLGLFWLAAHSRRRTVHQLELSGTGPGGRLTVESSALVESARTALEEASGLGLRSGRIVVGDRNERIVDLRVGLDPGADLDEAAEAAQRAALELAANLGPDSKVQYRATLTGQGRRSKVSRVQ